MITSDDLKKQYTAAISDLPASSLDSEGYLYWYPKFRRLKVECSTYCVFWYGDTSGINLDNYYFDQFNISVNLGDTGKVSSLSGSSLKSGGYYGSIYFRFYYKDTAPVSGYYSSALQTKYSYSGLDSSGTAFKPYSRDYSFNDPTYFSAGNSFEGDTQAYLSPGGKISYFNLLFHPMLVKIKPLSGFVDTSKDNSYGTSTRPGSLIGDFNIVNNNTTTKVENTTIVNETNNTYYNPVTNETHNYNDWTYDYSSRTYVFNTGDTITYGDEYVTIKEGDTIYNIYYYVNPTEPDPEPSECQHSYTAQETTPATCTDPGVRTYTCSKCGNQYVEQIAALGHDWLASEVVENTYSLPEGTRCPDCGGTNFTAQLDKDAGLYSLTCSDCQATWTAEAEITYGHTQYTCSRCGESYVESNNPDSGLFAAIGSFIAGGIDWVVDKLKQLVESLSGIHDIFSDFVDDLKEKSGEYPAFLGAVIALLPDDFMTVIWFSIVAAVALVVWKHWFR